MVQQSSTDTPSADSGAGPANESDGDPNTDKGSGTRIQRYALSHPSAYRWIRETLLGREANKETNDFSSLGSRVPVMSLQVRSETGSLMRLRIIDVAGEHVRWPKQGRVGYLLPSAIRRAGFVWIVRAMVSLVLGVESGNAREPELSDTSIARGRTEAGFSYMTGGLISDEQRAMERKSRPYNLKVVIASHLRPFISPVLLLIANNQSGRIEKVVLYAPWLYVQLPSGGYTIAARIENRIVLIRDIYLREDRRATFVLR